MTTLGTLSLIALLLPLAGCMFIGLAGMRLPAKAAGWVGSLIILGSFAMSIAVLMMWGGRHGELVTPYTWLTAGDMKVGFDLYIDPLSIMEMLIVSGVGFLIHVYSIGYMHADTQERRFFAYMNIFVFAMLLLVMAGNMVLLLAGWGLVGMASYLLIGFWHDRPSAVAAAKKAFVVNAIGDVSIMIGLFLIFSKVGAVTWPAVFEGLPAQVHSGSLTATAIALLIFGGCAAKSAQLPLHTWLPDAMEGPTPVSALIHAATMVTAGVYLVARMWPVFDLSPFAQQFVAVTGALTLVVAGLVALSQTDIKRVIAYSTMSQIGYMIMAVGIGAHAAGMFHLMTHAFFKALLFLAAGIVIHALADEQDIRKMGGLRKFMPTTYWLFVIGSLALAGIIPLSGFFSKDEILGVVLASASIDGATSLLVWGMALFGVLLTGIYSFRLLFLVFHGEPGDATLAYARRLAGEVAPTAEGAAHHDAHHGEAPRTMMWPVLALGALTATGGLIGIPGVSDVVGHFLDRAESAPLRHGIDAFSAGGAWAMSFVSILIALAGIGIASKVWNSGQWGALRAAEPAVDRILAAAFGFDALYDRVIVRPIVAVARWIRRILEEGFFAPATGWVASAARQGASTVSWAQSGLLRGYAMAMAAGVLIIAGWIVLGGRN